MISELSDLLRRSLSTVQRQEVMLEEDLEFLESYIHIQQLRFSDRLRMRYDIAPDSRHMLIPTLILQPLAENAIRHGLDRTARAVEIGVRSRVHQGRLVLEVSDDGPGLSGQPIIEGVGIGTARQRLEHLYGADAFIAIGPRPGGGTLVRLDLPAKPSAEGVL